MMRRVALLSIGCGLLLLSTETFALSSVLEKPVRKLSKGYRQREGLAQALLHDPEILILDEPTGGLDPNQIREVRHLIRSLAEEKTILLSRMCCRKWRPSVRASMRATRTDSSSRRRSRGGATVIRLQAGSGPPVLIGQ